MPVTQTMPAAHGAVRSLHAGTHRPRSHIFVGIGAGDRRRIHDTVAVVVEAVAHLHAGWGGRGARQLPTLPALGGAPPAHAGFAGVARLPATVTGHPRDHEYFRSLKSPSLPKSVALIGLSSNRK